MRSLRHYLLALLTAVLVMPLGWAQNTVGTSGFQSGNLSAYPPNISLGAAGPMMMLLASRDHTLFAPIYTDYEDLDGDLILDTTYIPTFRYYGYFDPIKCYQYNGTRNPARFEPVEMTVSTTNFACKSSGKYWGGNFLNWATMTRLDVIRKLLYGGFRREDLGPVDSSDTTLEMAQLSQDAHSFVKYYAGTDIASFTPFTRAALSDASGNYIGLTMCNRSTINTDPTPSQPGAPVIRVVKGNYSLWATIPTSQVCRWATEGSSYAFGNKAGAFFTKYGRDASGNAYPAAQAHQANLPDQYSHGMQDSAGNGPEFAVRVKACPAAMLGSERCTAYSSTVSDVTVVGYKPTGLLQDYGNSFNANQASRAEFGLLTGSYDSPLLAGALRKNMGSINDEVDLTTGRFCYGLTGTLPTGCSATVGIVGTFDRIRLYDTGNYNNQIRSLPSEYVLPQTITNGMFPSWGNPVSEMYVQALAYLGGTLKGTSGALTGKNDKDQVVGLPAPRAIDPIDDTTLDLGSGKTRSALFGPGICRAMNTVAISSSAVSYDTKESANEDNYNLFSVKFVGLNGADPKTLMDWTDDIGRLEGINGQSRSVGSVTAGFGSDCTSKDITKLSLVAGICPDAPAVKGTYLGAGAAFFANTNAIRDDSDLTTKTGAGIDKAQLPVGALRVKSYAATLAGGVARIEIPVPGSSPQTYVIITPESLWWHKRLPDGSLMPGAMLTFKAIGREFPSQNFGGSGSYVVTWNDTQFGGDYDMDLVGFIRWSLTKTGVSGQWQLEVLTDVIGHDAGDPGSHGFSIIGVDAASTTSGGTSYLGPGKYITHGSNGFNFAGGGGCAGYGDVQFDLLCRYANDGFFSDNFAWPTNYNDSKVGFFDDATATYTTTVSSKFLVSAGVTDATIREPLWYLAKYGSFDTGESAATPWADRLISNAKPDARNGAHNVNWDSMHNDGSACSAGVNCADGEPDGYFLARRPELLETRLRNLMDTSVNKSNSSVSVSSSQLIDGSYKYVAQFTESDTVRSGTVKAFTLDATTGLFATSPAWDAGDMLTAASRSSTSTAARQVITNNVVNSVANGVTTGVQTGQAFTTAGLVPSTFTTGGTLSAYMQALVGTTADPVTAASNLIGYVRATPASVSLEGSVYRARGSNVMGPVVDSSPWIQDPTATARFTDGDFPAGTPSYFSFIKDHANASKVLWVGSNDGMLHGFEALTGAPLLSYLPSPVVSRLGTAFSALNREATPLVDGSPFTADVLVGTSPAAWRTYLFGSLGRGGAAVFALDVTNPSGSTLTEANASSIFKWMFTAADNPNLGYLTTGPTVHGTSGQAHQVVRLNNGKFGLLVPNGYKSSGGRPALFILFVDGPGTTGWTSAGTAANYKMLAPLSTDTNNGLMGVTWVDLDNNGTADVVYGTDLKGQVWKFDIRSTDPSSWGSAFKNPNTGVAVPFFTASTCGGVPVVCGQSVSVTTNPVATLPSYGGVMVSFGTGRALEAGDFPGAGLSNRFISVWDKGRYAEDLVFPPPAPVNGVQSTFTPNVLPSMTNVPDTFGQILLRRSADGGVYRVTLDANNHEVPVSAGSVVSAFDPGSQDGWYFDFPGSRAMSDANADPGEQLIFSPTARRRFISFTSVRPLTTAERAASCSTNPRGTLYAIDPATGQAIPGLLNTVTLGSINTSGYGQLMQDTQITVVGDSSSRPTGTGQPSNSCGAGKVKARFLGQLTDSAGCIDAINLRLQWREIPGMKTK